MPEALIAVRVAPRASREGIMGWRDSVLAMRVTAPPEGGKANAAVCKLVAGAVGVPKSAVSVARGTAARTKFVRIEGLGQAEAEASLAAAAEGGPG